MKHIKTLTVLRADFVNDWLNDMWVRWLDLRTDKGRDIKEIKVR